MEPSIETSVDISYEGSDTHRVAELANRIAAEKRVLARRQYAEAQRKLDIDIQKALRTDLSSSIESAYGSGGMTDRFGDLVKASKSLGLIWQRIRSRTGYRSEHIISQVEGSVKVGIRVDKSGKLLKIMDSGAEGDRRLLGWVVLCIIDAFREPFEHLNLDGNVTLDLHFHFSLGDPVPPAEVGLRMVFPVIGGVKEGLLHRIATGDMEGLANDFSYKEDKGYPEYQIILLRISTDQITNMFKDKTLRNHDEWDYYAREDKYKHHCNNAKNPQGCLLLAGLYKSIGKQHESSRYEQLAREYEARRNSE